MMKSFKVYFYDFTVNSSSESPERNFKKIINSTGSFKD